MQSQNNLLSLSNDSLSNTKFEVAEGVLFSEVENEAILLDVNAGVYYGLSETSLIFWLALQNQQPLEPCVEKITNEYDVERFQVMEDLATFLNDLLKFGIIKQITASN